MSKQEDRKHYDVGYGKPPKNTRFQPGQSGNPNGRPRKTPNVQETVAELIRRILDEELSTGSGKKVTVREAAIRKAIAKAVEKGDIKTLLQIMEMAPPAQADEVDYRAELQRKLADLSKKMKAARGEIAETEPEKTMRTTPDSLNF